MITQRFRVFCFCSLALTGLARAQNDGDHLITNGLGQTSLATDLQVPVAPVNLTVGTTPGLGATLRVRGDETQLWIPDLDPLQPGMRCTFRTDVSSARAQSWRMYRDVNRIGAIWNESNHLAWHVQSLMNKDNDQDRYSGVMVQNEVSDGLWVMNDGTPTGIRAFPNAFQLVDAKGFAALGNRSGWLFTAVDRPRGPWSRFHLFHSVTGTTPWFAHRSQMRNGFTLTGNSDHAYMGQWYDQGTDGIGVEVDDNTNLVIATSEQDITPGYTHTWDNISFRNFGDLDQSDDGPVNGVEGLEMMRIQPARETAEAKVEGMVGIGDFLSAAAVPDERLHLLDKTIRLQDFGVPGLYNNNSFDRVLVVDPADGRVHWRDATTLGGGGGTACEWTLQGLPGTNSHISTAYTLNPGCPLMDKGVGIGLQIPKAKLHVFHDTYTSLVRTGVASFIDTQTGMPPEIFRGVQGNASPNASVVCLTSSIGVEGLSKNARNTIGVKGDVRMDLGEQGQVNMIGVQGLGTATNNKIAGLVNGVWGWATVDGGSSAGFTAGVIGGHTAPAALPNLWAGYFFGNVHATGVVTWASDQSLKSDAQSLLGATDILGMLQPKRYTYRCEEFPQLNLPQGEHMGLIAQEVQEVLPDLVKNVTSPALRDSTGNETAPAVDYLSLNYMELIPLLIAGNQELKARIDVLQEQISACCVADNGQRSLEQGNSERPETDLRVVPNPVADRTELRYTLAEPGRVRLEISDASGRNIHSQDEGERAAGSFVYLWDTTSLAPGTYHCALFVNNERLVEKAVKLSVR